MPKPDPNEQSRPETTNELDDPVQFAPHLVFIKQLMRLDEAMANGRDAWDAFDCWRSGLHAFGREDNAYKIESQLLRAWERKKSRRFSAIPDNIVINKWRPCLIGVMRRAGMFNRIDAVTSPEGASAAREGAALNAVKRKVSRS